MHLDDEQVRRIHEVDSHFKPSVQSAIEFFAPEARDIMSAAFKNAMSHGRDYDLELPLITAMGRRIWVRALTRAEFRLLWTLAQRPGRVYSRNELVDEITAGEAVIIDRNVDVHVSSIRRKLGDAGKMIATVRGVGYKCAD